MRRTRLCVAVLTLLSAWLFAGVGAGSGGTTTLTGAIEDATVNTFNPYRLGIVYTATGAEDNEVRVSEPDLSDPTGQRTETYLFKDRSIDTASGYCRRLILGFSECYEPTSYEASDLPLYMASIRVDLGAGDDSLRLAPRTEGPLIGAPGVEFSVWAGPGDDFVSLEDYTGWDTQFGDGRDRVDCGDGDDRAVVSDSVDTINCEQVSVVTQSI